MNKKVFPSSTVTCGLGIYVCVSNLKDEMTKLAEHMEMKVHIMHSAFKESIFEFAMTAELKK